jgi:hypothetical protein
MNRRPMRRLSELLPDAVAALGIREELATAGRERSFESLVAELVPAAAGRCALVEVRPPQLIVRADDPATAQELRLQGSTLLAAFAAGAGADPPTELRVVVRLG